MCVIFRHSLHPIQRSQTAERNGTEQQTARHTAVAHMRKQDLPNHSKESRQIANGSSTRVSVSVAMLIKARDGNASHTPPGLAQPCRVDVIGHLRARQAPIVARVDGLDHSTNTGLSPCLPIGSSRGTTCQKRESSRFQSDRQVYYF